MKTKAIMFAAAMLAGAAQAQELPSQMKWTAFQTDSASYAHAIAVGNMLKEHGTRVAVLPGQNDIARLTPMKNGQAGYCMCGVAAYFSTEGVTNFAAKGWGPQPLRMILAKIDGSGVGFATRGDSGIETAADLKGKRVPLIRAAASTNVPLNSMLAFGGLTRDDVETVTYSAFSGQWDGVINGQSDVAFATTLTPKSAQLASGPNGIHWIPMPHDDDAAWARLHEVAPYLAKRVVTHASGLPEGESFDGAGYPYPLLVTMAEQGADEVYALTKAMVENLNSYKDSAPGADGWALDVQDFLWVIPFHEGAVRYFRDAGVWTDEAEAHNQRLIARQQVIADAWASFDQGAAGEGEAFEKAWLVARAEALRAAELPVVYE